eukprot:COSAG02_NODE_32217_length_520_cov_0.610451_1_plen_64_part_10
MLIHPCLRNLRRNLCTLLSVEMQTGLPRSQYTELQDPRRGHVRLSGSHRSKSDQGRSVGQADRG